MSFVKKNNASFFLFLNSLLWGSSYVWSKMLLGYMPRFTILFICALGGLVSTIILFYRSLKTINIYAVIASIAVSMFSIISNTFFMFALQYTSSSNTAFIVQMSVIITPLLMALLERKLPKGKIIIGALIAITGLFLMTCDFKSFRLNIGDLFALGNALFFSIFLTSLNYISKKVEAVHFTFIHHITNTVAFFTIAGLFEFGSVDLHQMQTPIVPVLVLISISIAVITVLLQSASIKFVRPEKATLIYTLEPVAALILASVLIGERLDGIKSIAGCILILLSVIITLYKPGIWQRSFAQRTKQKSLVPAESVLH